MNRQDLIALNSIVDRENPETFKDAVGFILSREGTDYAPADENEALAYLTAFLHALLSADRYVDAALFLWGLDRFDPRPRCVQKLWNALLTQNKLLVLGHGSSSKTYGGTAFHLLDWLRDPANTNIKIVSTSEGHVRNNAWSKLADFHSWACIPIAGEMQSDILCLDPLNRQAAITMATVPQGPDSKARLQGFHPVPRKTGKGLTRVRAMMDEAEKIATGVWDGIDNMLVNEDDAGSVRIYGCTNPEDRSSPFARRAEPKEGWDSVDPLEAEEWTSKEGWHVLHFDGRKCENVTENKIVFPGLMTPQGFSNLKRRGLNDAKLYTFGYGWYPTATQEFAVCPPYILKDIKGVFSFYRTPHNVAALDPAFAEGGDKAVLTVGRYGLVNGWKDPGGKLHKLSQRWALQIDQQFEIPKGNSIDMGDRLIEMFGARKLNVRPEWFAMDCTGPGTGLRDYLFKKYGEILGVKWGEKATEKKVLHEDKETADKLYAGLVSEMCFAFAKWCEYEYVKIAPMMDTIELFSQTTNRHYRENRGTLSQVESKDEFKKRTGGQSPDEFDSLIQVVHLCRMRGEDRAAMMADEPKAPTDPDVWTAEGWSPRGQESTLQSTVDVIPFLKFEE